MKNPLEECLVRLEGYSKTIEHNMVGLWFKYHPDHLPEIDRTILIHRKFDKEPPEPLFEVCWFDGKLWQTDDGWITGEDVKYWAYINPASGNWDILP